MTVAIRLIRLIRVIRSIRVIRVNKKAPAFRPERDSPNQREKQTFDSINSRGSE
jgi:hypothetical protein